MPPEGVRKLQLRDLFSHPAHFFALGFGAGLSPWAPGTFGTLAALPLYWLINQYSPDLYIWLVSASILIGIYLCGETAKNLNSPDHGGIVWDEIAGYGVTMLWLPFSLQWALAGFVLFRVFDILKPWPIRWLDKHVHAGVGIMLDDIVAGAMACAILHVLRVALL